MADMKTIVVPIEFEASAKQYKAFIAQIEEDFKKIKPGTAIATNLANSIKSAKKMMDKIDFDMSFGITKNSDISKLTTDFQSLYYTLDKIGNKFENLQIGDLNIHQGTFGNLATDLQNAQKQLDEFRATASKLKSQSVGEMFSGKQELKLFNKNELGKTGTTALRDLNSEIEQTTIKMNEASSAAASLEKKIATLQTKRQGKEVNNTAEAILGVTNLAGDSLKNRKDRLKEYIEKNIFTQEGTLRKKMDPAQAEEFLNAFFPDEQILQKEAKERLAIVEKALNELKLKTTDKVHKDYAEKGRESREAREIDTQMAQAQKEYDAELANVSGLKDKIDRTQKKATSIETHLKSNGVIAENGQAIPKLDKRLDDLEKTVQSIQNKIMKQAPTGKGPSSPDGGGGPPPVPSGDLAKGALEAQQSAKDFKANLQQAISRWFSAQQVINLIRDGIRQAISDIKGLDTAMTNIAVVTDMSVSELWGKIDEYMAIAQQYGVTTQGVYEVSQLYYQQGLSTSEVMAATTETLKMARIAGMEYSEAADAMTVAIRAFKMEMSDAQHVTDVYSKVAAVTASDTEELAVAMSKTASSAESVGSSFENTTAMLAVMIETTRESAQNLGSALKSIISRYGEMKVGLTVDSEGEEIDYNKTDTALKSIGISIKDAQGQFRDFDEVIFELSEKWDSLDKNTQRYIATIMAGNRQQSRFIALVDNWERLDEVAGSAQDSEDAGLLQYAKTLDSLDTKINNIKTSFQEFYMSIFNGETFKQILDGVNNIIKGLTKLGSLQGILNFANIFLALKTGLKGLTNLFSNSFGGILTNWKNMQDQWLNLAVSSGYNRGYQEGVSYANGFEDGAANNGNVGPGTGVDGTVINRPADFLTRRQQGDGSKKVNWGKGNSWNGNVAGRLLSIGGSIGAGILSTISTNAASKGNLVGSGLAATGANVLQGASMGSMFGPWGAAIGALLGLVTSIDTLTEAFDPLNRALAEEAKAKQKADDKKVEAVEARDKADTLNSEIKKLEQLRKARYQSAEAEKEYQTALSSFQETYPNLVNSISEGVEATLDAQQAEIQLAQAREEAAQIGLEASEARYAAALSSVKTTKTEQNKVNSAYEKNYGNIVTSAVTTDWAESALKQLFGESAWDFGTKYLTDENAVKGYLEQINSIIAEFGGDLFVKNEDGNYELSEGASDAEAVTWFKDNLAGNKELFDSFYDTIYPQPEQSNAQTVSLDSLKGLNREDYGESVSDYDFDVAEEVNSILAGIKEVYGRGAYNAVKTKIEDYEVGVDDEELEGFDKVSKYQEGYISVLEAAISELESSRVEGSKEAKANSWTETAIKVADTYSDVAAQVKSDNAMGEVDTDFIQAKLNLDLDIDHREAQNAAKQMIADASEYSLETILGGETEKLFEDSYYNLYDGIEQDIHNAVMSAVEGTLLDEEGLMKEEYWDKDSESFSQAGRKAVYTAMQEVLKSIVAEDSAFGKELNTQQEKDEYAQFKEDWKAGKVSVTDARTRYSQISANNPNDPLIKQAKTELDEISQANSQRYLNFLQTINKQITQDSLQALDMDDYTDPMQYALMNYIESISQQLTSNNVDSKGANDAMASYLKLFNYINESFSEGAEVLTSADLDLSTEFGVLEVYNKLVSMGADAEQLARAMDITIKDGQITAVNYSTYADNASLAYQTFENKIISGLENIHTTLSNAAEGLNVEDALQLANKLGKDFQEIFSFKDGKYYLNDSTVIDDYYSKVIEEEKALLTKQIEDLSEKDVSKLSASEKTSIYNYWKSQQDSEAKIPTEAQFWQNLPTGAIESYQGYLQTLLTSRMELLTEESEWLKAYAERQVKINKIINDFNTAGYKDLLENPSETATTEQIEAYKLLRSKGREGYTAEDIATLQESGLLEANQKIGTIMTGIDEYKIDDTSWNTLLGLFSTTFQNGLRNIAQGQTESALDSLYSIGESLGQKEKVDLTPYLKETLEKTEAEIEAALLAAFTAAAATEGAALTEDQITQLEDITGRTREEIQKMYEGYLVGAENVEKEFRDLTKKYYQDGKLSGSDLKRFTELGGVVLENIELSLSERFNGYLQVLNEEVASGELELGEIPSLAVDFLETAINQTGEAYKAAKESIEKEVMDALASTGGKGLTQAQLAQIQYASGLIGDIYSSDGKGGYNIDEGALKLLNLMYADSFAQYEETTIRNRIKATEDFLQTALSDTSKVETSQVQELYKSLGKDITWKEAQSIAETIVEGGAAAAITATENAVDGLNIPGIEERIQRLAQLIFDSIIDEISSGFSDLSSGLSGELSMESYAKLVDKYGLSGKALKTATGLTLSKADQKQMLISMYGSAQAQGATLGFGQQALTALSESGITYSDIQEELVATRKTVEEANKKNAVEWTEAEKSAQEYLKVLEQINSAAQLDPNSSMFDFMNQDPTDGLTQNFDTFVGSIEQVQGIFETFKSGEAISYKDFYNMMDFMNDQGQWNNLKTNFENLGATFNETNSTYENFVNSIVRNTDKWGKVDIGGVAADMNISVDAAMEAMQNSMADGLKQVAQDQIKYLSGLEKMLLAMQALNEVDVSLGFSITTQSGEDVPLTLANIYQYWDDILALPDNEKNFIIKPAIDKKTGEIDSILDEAFGANLDWNTLFFGKDGFSFTEAEAQMASLLGSYVQALNNASQGQAEYLAGGLWDVVAPYLEYDSATATYSIKAGEEIGQQLTQAVFDYLKTSNNWSDLESIPSLINSQISEKIGKTGTIEIPYGEGDITLTAGEGGQLTIAGLNPEDIKTEEVKKSVIAALNEALGTAITDITYNAETGGWQFYGTTQSEEDSKNIAEIETKFQNTATAAQAINTAINGINGGIAAFTYSGPFKEFLEAIISAAAAAEKLKGLTGVGADTTTTSDGSGGGLPPIHYAPPTAQSSIPQAIAYGDNGPIFAEEAELPTIKVTADTTEAEEKIDETKQKIEEENPKIGMGANTEEAEGEKDELLDTINNSSATATIDGDPTLAHQALQGFLNTPAVKHIKLVASPLLMKWTGTMNDISGSAFADGSIGRLHSGAQLANKVLVGELGPELAVYDGQYHMLGANGAEFVNLPKDAIIFNHLQTQGILNGQMNIRGTAMAEGNVSGPAFAGGDGIAAALAAVRRAKSVWQGLLKNLSAAELFGGGGGGGGGGGDNSIKAVTQELEEWYNLSRQIAYIEQEINNLIAERANIQKKNGEEYLESLRKQQELLYDQIATQDTLLQYQKLQLERQAQHINSNAIWSQFLTVGEDGLLQYKIGNETDDGKGQLSVLQQMNEMSGAQQLAFIQSLGYTYTDQDGKKLEGEELIAKFFEELQQQIDDYDNLYDIVHETLAELEELETQIEEINTEIKENQMDLEQSIYDIIVSAWEKEIEQMQEQAELIKEANNEYLDGLNKAIEEERKLYDQQQSVSDREALQRQLSLLRRSGGSAQEIYDLEQQLDDMLKDEYFNNQEKMIENIQDANEEQVRKLEEQIKLQEDALAYQKENGVLWSKVYEVLSGSTESIMAFMQNGDPGFFEQSNLKQEEMLTEWSKKVGIYTADQERKNYEADASKMWTNGTVWNGAGLAQYQDVYNAQSTSTQTTLQNLFNSTYANALMEGKTHEQALEAANTALIEHLKSLQAAANAQQNNPNTGNQNQNQTTGTQGTQQQQQDKKEYWGFRYNGRDLKWEGKLNAENAHARYLAEERNKMRNDNTAYQNWASQQKVPSTSGWLNYVEQELKKKIGNVHKYSTGGLVDYTGLAMVHGSSSKPEAFLNAEQTAQIREALGNSGKGSVLNNILDTLRNLQHSISSINQFITDSSKTITISPNAINISVGQLADSYDVEDLSNDIMNRIASIAAKATGRGVNRR